MSIPTSLKTWTPLNTPRQDPDYAEQVLGSEVCAWELGNYSGYPYYAYTTTPSIAILGDKIWSYGDRNYSDSEYRAALSEFIFGSDEYTDVFDCVGSLIPPRSIYYYTLNKSLTREEAERCLEHIKTNTYRDVSRRFALLINNILSKM